jgi:SAM-dependent methyltransferase
LQRWLDHRLADWSPADRTACPLPPERLMFVGGGDFEAIGNEFLGHFIQLGRLQPHEHVLDVGSGIGRMARPLTTYLNRLGAYDGIEIVSEGVDWCRAHITPRNRRFRFHRANVFNRHYNPAGRVRAADYRFPFGDATFDFVFLTSVFTHMFPEDVAHYLAEIARVLKPGGRVLATYFLLNEESMRRIEAGGLALDFRFRHARYWTVSEESPEGAIALHEHDVLAMVRDCGLMPEPIRHGAWSGRAEHLSFQDILVATRP